MDINELRKMPHLSATALIDYLSCGIQYRFGRVEKRPIEFIPDAMEFGSSVHKVLAEYYLAKKAGRHMPITEMQRLFEKYWSEAAKDNDQIRYKDGKDYETLLREGKELLSVYASSQPETSYKVIAVEEPLVFEIPGINIPILGVLDLVEEDDAGSIIVTDHKTTSKAYSFDDVSNNIQVALYGIGLKQNGYADREVLLKFDCLIKTKVPKFEQYYTTRSEEDEIKLIKKIQHAYQGISAGIYLPCLDSWKCKGCVYSKTCDEYLKS